MVAEILLHVGMHKTGTTALQSALDGYDDGSSRYARLDQPNHSVAFVTCFSTQPHRYHVWARIGATPERVAQERARLRAMIDAELALDRARLIVVGEEISLLPSAPVRSMADQLGTGGRRVSVLAYLRDPWGYLTSAYQQQVRGGQVSFTLPRPHYRARFEKFIATFGGDCVRFRAYRPDCFCNGSVVCDFAALAGLGAETLGECRANRAIPLEAIRLIHLLNRSGLVPRSQPGLAARSAFVRHVAALGDTPFLLGPDIAGGVIDPEEIAWIEGASGLSFGPLPTPVEAEQAEAALARLILHIPAETTDRLRALCAGLGLAASGADDAETLVTRLYQALLAAETGRSGARARLA